MTAAILAVCAAAFSAALWVGPAPGRDARRRLGAAAFPASRSWHRPPAGSVRLILALCAFAAIALLFAGRLPLLILAMVAVLALCALSALRERLRASKGRQRVRREVTELCDALASELAIGAPPAVALRHAATDWPLIGPVAAAAQLGGDVVAAFETAARLPGAEALRSVGAAWDVSARSGASLSGVLDRLSATLRDDQDARREIDACLGPPRATARLLAVLPVIGLALGTGVGSNPWTVITGSVLGAGCVAVGTALAVIGVFWVEQIATRAEA